MDRFDFIIITLAGWYFHPGQKRTKDEFMKEVVELGTQICNALEAGDEWQSQQPQSQEQPQSGVDC